MILTDATRVRFGACLVCQLSRWGYHVGLYRDRQDIQKHLAALITVMAMVGPGDLVRQLCDHADNLLKRLNQMLLDMTFRKAQQVLMPVFQNQSRLMLNEGDLIISCLKILCEPQWSQNPSHPILCEVHDRRNAVSDLGAHLAAIYRLNASGDSRLEFNRKVQFADSSCKLLAEGLNHWPLYDHFRQAIYPIYRNSEYHIAATRVLREIVERMPPDDPEHASRLGLLLDRMTADVPYEAQIESTLIVKNEVMPSCDIEIALLQDPAVLEVISYCSS